MPAWFFDSVFEYRTYVFMLPWAALLALLPREPLLFLLSLWIYHSQERAGYYRTNLDFWEQAFKESPAKTRVRTRHIEQLLIDLERKYKQPARRWEDLQPEIDRVTKLIEGICDAQH